MRPDERFRNQPKDFWAHVRSLSEALGYTERGTGTIKVHGLSKIRGGLTYLRLNTDHILDDRGRPTEFGKRLADYYDYRASVLNTFVQPRLMDAEDARRVFEEVRARCNPPESILPLNKQKGEKKTHAYLTGLVNMMIHERAPELPVTFDPRLLTTVTRDGRPLRTLARRVDGACPGVVNPIAIWEIKEYYYTTTFGSRVADGVYETLLDGMELQELREHEAIDVKHYLMVDSRFTWWECGKSYLCRIIDMLHMGYVDEVLFGREVLERMPEIVDEWAVEYARRGGV